MVGLAWRLAAWDRVEGADPERYVLEFVFEPETRAPDEQQQEAADRAAQTVSAALNEVLSRPEYAFVRRALGWEAQDEERR